MKWDSYLVSGIYYLRKPICEEYFEQVLQDEMLYRDY